MTDANDKDIALKNVKSTTSTPTLNNNPTASRTTLPSNGSISKKKDSISNLAQASAEAEGNNTSFEFDETEEDDDEDCVEEQKENTDVIYSFRSLATVVPNLSRKNLHNFNIQQRDQSRDLNDSASTSTAPLTRAINSAAASATTDNNAVAFDTARSTSRTTLPLVAIRDDFDEGSDHSDESHTDSSSTPTTAEMVDSIAPTASASVSPSPYMQKLKRLSPLQTHTKLGSATVEQLVVAHNGSIAEDNISGSIATTTTDIDMDGSTNGSANVGVEVSGSVVTADDNDNDNAAYTSPHAGLSELSVYQTTVLTSGTSIKSHRRNLSTTSYRSNASLKHRTRCCLCLIRIVQRFKSSGIGDPSVWHALVVIFLEFFAWGLLTMPVIAVLNQTFPDHTFLMNGLVMGIKGILSFLSAPLIGALSDIWGRKFFLLITVFFTCAPIPLMTLNSWWFFAMISISGVFAVTFSVVFAYVADVTSVEERSRAYGLVSATFAASLVISPALGAFLMELYSDTLVVALGTAIAILDVFFILVAVPESLPEKVRPSTWGAPISWEQADPFAALRKVGSDHTILMQCVTVLLSYLPEAGQYSCIFVYLKLKMGFNSMEVAIFIAVVGILSIIVQVTLGTLMRVFGAKHTIIIGLILEMIQLLWYGFGNEKWMMWAAGILASLASITYPAISAFVSIHSNAHRQGAVQGMVTGMRGLCNGLGPAMFGVIFYLFNVDLNASKTSIISITKPDETTNQTLLLGKYSSTCPGPPFAFGALMVIAAILVAWFIPDKDENLGKGGALEKKRVSIDVQYEIDGSHKSTSALAPLMRSDSLAQL